MKKMEIAISTWQEIMIQESSRPWSTRLNSGEMKLCHYKGFLLETFHNTSKNPQLQAFSTIFFKNISHAVTKKFFLHASSEVTHEILAFKDLLNLGVPQKLIESSLPLPTTRALSALAIHNLIFESPIKYLGYLFHLEYTPMVNGPKIIEMLKSLGIPEQALTFINEHAKVDPALVKMLAEYMEELVKTDSDIEQLKIGIRDFVVLHNRMLEGAFENGEKLFSKDELNDSGTNLKYA